MKAIYDAIYAKFAPSGTKPSVYSDLGGRMYPHEAPQGVTFPYGVYMLIGDSPDYYFDDEQLEDLTVQFMLFDKPGNSSSVNLMTYYGHLDALYNKCSLTVVGYTHLEMVREWGYPLRDLENNIWQYVVQYGVLLEL